MECAGRAKAATALWLAAEPRGGGKGDFMFVSALRAKPKRRRAALAAAVHTVPVLSQLSL